MRKSLLLIMILICFKLFSQLSSYELEVFKTIAVGKELGEIGWAGSKPSIGAAYSPSTFSFNKKGEVYIPDLVNKRINIYDSNLNYLRTIVDSDNKARSHHAIKIVFTDDESFFSVSYNSLVKSQNDGKTLFVLNTNKDPYSSYRFTNIHYIDEKLYFYMYNGFILSIDSLGNLLSNKESIKNLAKANQKYKQTSRSVGDDFPDSLLLEGKHIILGDKYFNSSFEDLKRFNYKNNESKGIVNSRSIGSNKKLPKIRNHRHIGTDSDDNTYWVATVGKTEDKVIVVLSKSGLVLDAFIFDNIKKMREENLSPMLAAVSYSGDVFFMRGEEEKYNFWKVKRVW